MMNMMPERISDKELSCMVDNLNERLREIYDEQLRVQQELTFLVELMLKRGLELAKNSV